MQINFARHVSRLEPTAISDHIVSRKRLIIRSRALTMAILLAVCEIGFATPVFAIDLPAWAYPLNPPDYKPAPDDGVLRRVPGSVVVYPLSQTRNLFFAPDWHPEDHPAMPAIVARGRMPDVYACGFCHRATGQGGPENANITGLPFDYIVQQLRDYRAGVRTTAMPQRVPQKFMIASAKLLTDAEIHEAATYFSQLKPRRNIRVIEAETVPKPVVANWTWVDHNTGEREVIGKRIVEVPEHLEDFELRDAHTTFIGYVPPGSLMRGAALVTGKLPQRVAACASCHGADLRGMTIAPPIAGRSASYAIRQLYEFKTGLRTGANAALMKAALEKLDEDDLLAIAAYLASQTP